MMSLQLPGHLGVSMSGDYSPRLFVVNFPHGWICLSSVLVHLRFPNCV